MSRSVSSLVARFYLFQATSSVGFLTPFWVIFLVRQDLSYTTIALLDAAFFAVILVSEIPTGYVGDRIGRRNAMVVSSLMLAVSVVAFSRAHTPLEFLVDYAVWAVSSTFRSGNDSAWLYDTLAAHGEVGAFARVRSRGFAVFYAVTAVAALAGGVLATRDITWPFLATGALNVLSAGVLLTMPEPPQIDDHTFTLDAAIRALRRLLEPDVRGFVAYASVFLAIAWSVDLYVQPIVTSTGVSLFGLGVLYAVMTGASAVGSSVVDRITAHVAPGRLLRWLPVAVALAYLPFTLLPLVAVPAFLLARVALSVFTPLAETTLNDTVPSLGRATVLSGYSMVVSLVTIPLKIASGPLADASLYLTVTVFGVVLLASLLGLLAARRPVANAVRESNG